MNRFVFFKFWCFVLRNIVSEICDLNYVLWGLGYIQDPEVTIKSVVIVQEEKTELLYCTIIHVRWSYVISSITKAINREEHEHDRLLPPCPRPHEALPSHAFRACASSFQWPNTSVRSQYFQPHCHWGTYLLGLANDLVCQLRMTFGQVFPTINSDTAWYKLLAAEK